MKIWVKDKKGIYQIEVPQKIKIVYQEKKGLSAFAKHSLKKGENLSDLRGHLVEKEKASPLSIQFDEKYFIGADNDDFFWEDFINHSCDHNTFVDIKKRVFIAVRDIKKDEEITFNYLTTEYDMKEMGTDFKCLCKSKNCFKNIKGFKYLSKKQKLKLKPFLSPYLLTKM